MNRVQIIFIVLIIVFGFLVSRQMKQGDLSEKAATDYRQQPTQAPDEARTYKVELLSDTKKLKSGELTHITYKIKNDKDETLKHFEVSHEKVMHLIVVRKDLQYFQHVHPTYDVEKSEFMGDVNFPTDGQYVLYADFTPAKFADNSKLQPFTASIDVAIGNQSKYKPVTQKMSSGKKTINDYEVVYEVPSDLRAKKEVSYGLVISKKGEPVSNLEQYLGAMGHSIVINTKTMQYIHTHAGEMSEDHGSGHSDHNEETSGPNISFRTTFPEVGIYKIFTEFKHDEKVMMAEYVVEVK